MRKTHHILCFLVVVASLSVHSATAEIVCSAEVLYKWSKQDISSNAADGSSGSAGLAVSGSGDNSQAPAGKDTLSQTPGATDAPTPYGTTAPSAAGQPLGGPGLANTVKFALVERRAGDEPSAKSALLLELQRQKLRAAERCKRAHESYGECVTTKLSIKSSTLNSLSFSARAQAEKALMDECQIQQGRCLSVEASEPSCRGADAAGAASEGTGQGKAPEKGSAEASKEPAQAAKKEPPAKPAAKKK